MAAHPDLSTASSTSQPGRPSEVYREVDFDMVVIKPTKAGEAAFELELTELGTEIWEEEIDEDTVILYKEQIIKNDSETYLLEDNQQVGSQKPSREEAAGPSPGEEGCKVSEETTLQPVIDTNQDGETLMVHAKSIAQEFPPPSQERTERQQDGCPVDAVVNSMLCETPRETTFQTVIDSSQNGESLTVHTKSITQEFPPLSQKKTKDQQDVHSLGTIFLSDLCGLLKDIITETDVVDRKKQESCSLYQEMFQQNCLIPKRTEHQRQMYKCVPSEEGDESPSETTRTNVDADKERMIRNESEKYLSEDNQQDTEPTGYRKSSRWEAAESSSDEEDWEDCEDWEDAAFEILIDTFEKVDPFTIHARNITWKFFPLSQGRTLLGYQMSSRWDAAGPSSGEEGCEIPKETAVQILFDTIEKEEYLMIRSRNNIWEFLPPPPKRTKVLCDDCRKAKSKTSRMARNKSPDPKGNGASSMTVQARFM